MNRLERGVEDAIIRELTQVLGTLEETHRNLDDAETDFYIGDLLAIANYPSLITHRYGGSEKGEVQAYRLGPILICRESKGSEQAFALWIDPEPEIEQEMAEDARENLIRLREALSAMGLKNNCEIPQHLLAQLTESPLIVRAGTFEGLTKPKGKPVPFGLRLVLATYNLLPGVVHNAGLLGRTAMGLREKMFSNFNPLRRKRNAFIARNSQSAGICNPSSGLSAKPSTHSRAVQVENDQHPHL